MIVALLQTAGMTTSQLFLAARRRSLLVAVAIGRTMPASALSDALSIIYRALFRIEVKGLENLNKAGPNVIIALNHVSFLDAGLALSLRNRKPVFAIDVGIAKTWWVRPFLKLTHAMPLDPMKPMATRTLINAVKAGNALIIFPEGRITVTGSLMKVYDGAAMIADKSDAEIVPVRIEGLEQTPFSRLSKGQVRRALVPEGDGHDARAGASSPSIPSSRAASAGRRPARRSTASCPTSCSAPPRPTAPCSRR